MAISDELPGVKVAIRANGKDLKEYRDPDLDDDTGTTTRYIEAVSGQAFTVRITVPKGFKFPAGNVLSFHVFVDGRWIDNPLAFKKDCRTADIRTKSRGYHVSQKEVRTLQFSSLETGQRLWLY